MNKHTLALATLALIGSVTSAAHAATPKFGKPPATSFQAATSAAGDGVTFTFTDLDLLGYEFSQLAGSLTAPIYGTLTGVAIDATITFSVDETWANDLTLYVAYAPLDFGGLLQVGSVGDLGAAETIAWANGADGTPGTAVTDSVTLGTPIKFTGAASDPEIWLGNGYSFVGDEEGVWTGSITLYGLSLTAAVPEPETTALFFAGAAGVLAWASRRRRNGTQAG